MLGRLGRRVGSVAGFSSRIGPIGVRVYQASRGGSGFSSRIRVGCSHRRRRPRLSGAPFFALQVVLKKMQMNTIARSLSIIAAISLSSAFVLNPLRFKLQGSVQLKIAGQTRSRHDLRMAVNELRSVEDLDSAIASAGLI